MNNFRLIGRLDIKSGKLVKTVNLEGLRVLGDPSPIAEEYYLSGIDEFIILDCVASLYGRNSSSQVIKNVTREVFVPVTAGGGIRNSEDALELLRSGADRIAVNTAAVRDPGLLNVLVKRLGTSTVVASIDVLKLGPQQWEVIIENGRERTGLDALHWAFECFKRGVGEILVTSVNQEGTGEGLDLELMHKIASQMSIPVVASGGVGSTSHILDLVKKSQISGVALSRFLHLEKQSIGSLKLQLFNNGVPIRSTFHE